MNPDEDVNQIFSSSKAPIYNFSQACNYPNIENVENIELTSLMIRKKQSLQQDERTKKKKKNCDCWKQFMKKKTVERKEKNTKAYCNY